MNQEVINFRNHYQKQTLPIGYSGPRHVLFSATLLLSSSLIWPMTINLETLKWTELITLPIFFLLANFAVYIIHKFPLHRNLPFMQWAYTIHSKQHHRYYTHENFTFNNWNDFHLLLFPKLVVVGHCLIAVPMIYLLMRTFSSANVASLAAFMSSFYFILYEVFHFISHLPHGHWALKTKYLAYMHHHHRIHHDPRLMHNYNFNIVCPLFDKLLGTSKNNWN